MPMHWLLPDLILLAAATAAAPAPLPIIDMHVHASRLAVPRPIAVCPGDRPLIYPALDPKDPLPDTILVKCAEPILSPTTSEELLVATISELRRHNVRRAVLAGESRLVGEWRKRAPHLFIPATVPNPPLPDSLKQLRQAHAQGAAAVFAELGAQYLGLRADDPKLEDFWALAEELDVPVGIHLGEASPGATRQAGQSSYRAALTTPFQLEQVLVRHPGLRVYVMHYGSPLVDEMISMLFTHPNLYVDVSANVWNMPRAQFYDHLRRMVEAGFSQRILFGSDQTIWPSGIGLAIRTIEAAPFLTPDQKRDIFYNNAARFLRLTEKQIADDHSRAQR